MLKRREAIIGQSVRDGEVEIASALDSKKLDEEQAREEKEALAALDAGFVAAGVLEAFHGVRGGVTFAVDKEHLALLAFGT